MITWFYFVCFPPYIRSCICAVKYCVGRVPFAEGFELARVPTRKELVKHNIFPYICNKLFIVYFHILFKFFYLVYNNFNCESVFRLI